MTSEQSKFEPVVLDDEILDDVAGGAGATADPNGRPKA